MARFCVVCVSKLGFWDFGKMCPECHRSYMAMIKDETSTESQETAREFRRRLPAITDEETHKMLEWDIVRILGSAVEEPESDEPVMHTTLSGFKGFRILEYKGIVIAKEIQSCGSAKAMDQMLSKTAVSYEALDREARKLGANAVIGIDFSCAGISGLQNDNLSKVMETVTGTAVVVEPMVE